MERRSRAQRRQDARAGGSPARKRRDPISAVFLGFAIIMALVFLGFGITNWVSNHSREQAAAFDTATPTPAASPAHQRVIQLRDGQSIGLQQGFARADLARGVSADTAVGGHGAPVNGIPCQAEMVAVHVHSHLALYVHGRQIQIPGAIGMAPTPQGGCLYWLHTHGPDGIVHVEAASPDAPAGGHYTLGMFFDIWGTPLSRTRVGPFMGNVTAFVGGIRYDLDPRTIPLRSRQQITLEVGEPLIDPPPSYALPPND